MTQAAAIGALLGGKGTLKGVKAEADLERAVRGGLPTETLRVLAQQTNTTLSVLQQVAGIDRGTFARRSRTHAKLKADESDRLVRVARVAALAIEAMGRADGLAWLHEPNRALGERVPLELLATEIGSRQVEQIIGRVEHGVFS